MVGSESWVWNGSVSIPVRGKGIKTHDEESVFGQIIEGFHPREG